MSVCHYCELFIKTESPWILRLEIKEPWNRHEIIIEALQRGYLTKDEAACVKTLYRHWGNSLPKSVIPLDRTIYKRRVENPIVVAG